jgi:hypothetical protein
MSVDTCFARIVAVRKKTFLDAAWLLIVCTVTVFRGPQASSPVWQLLELGEGNTIGDTVMAGYKMG